MQQIDLYWVSPVTQAAKKIIIIDDVRITGAHEERLVHFLEEEGFQEVFFIYIAELKEQTDPFIEYTINHQAILEIQDLLEIWFQEGFRLNARVCKYLLGHSDPIKLAKFAQNLPEKWCRNIAEGMRLDGYTQMDMYKDNWKIWEPYANRVNETFEESIFFYPK